MVAESTVIGHRISTMPGNVIKSDPPVFDDENMSWKEYKKEIFIWQALTTLEVKKQGPALYLSLKGRAKEVAKGLSQESIIAEDGIDKILNELDKVFKKDENQEAYIAYKNFEEYKRCANVPVKDFVIRFEALHSKIKGLGMILPEAVQAYRLLHSANLHEEETKLCLATIVTLDYSSMKSQILKICGDEVASGSSRSNNPVDTVKEEPVFYNYNRGRPRGHSQYSRGGFVDRGQYTHQRGRRGRGTYQSFGTGHRGRGQSTPNRAMNPPGPDGEISRCSMCESKYHWIKDCPEMTTEL